MEQRVYAIPAHEPLHAGDSITVQYNSEMGVQRIVIHRRGLMERLWERVGRWWA